MSKIIDVAKAQEALDRAAHNAVHGSRDVRTGRFVAGDSVAPMPARKPRPSRQRVLCIVKYNRAMLDERTVES